jgi:hypothetical protein
MGRSTKQVLDRLVANRARKSRRRTGRELVTVAHVTSEAGIQQTCSDWLALDGWRRLRTNPVSNRSRGAGFGELGMADDLYIRYHLRETITAINTDLGHPVFAPFAEVAWIEWKRERGGTGKRGLYTKAEKAKIHQRAWIAAEKARGALVLLAGEDFPANIEGFQQYYRSSGLMRRKI